MTSASVTPAAATPRAKTSARLYAVQAVYQMLLSGMDAPSVYNDVMVNRVGIEPELDGIERPAPELLSAILQGVAARRDDLDPVLSAHLKNGEDAGAMTLKEPLLYALLLCGIYELMAHLDIDAPVIISDYLDVAHAYYQGNEPRMVNGILDAIRPLYRV